MRKRNLDHFLPEWDKLKYCEMERLLMELDTIKHNKLDGVEFARDPETELHSRLEWDDTKAAQKYRVWQLSKIIENFG